MKLKVGDIIQVHGYVMLAKLEGENRYRVAKISEYGGAPTYAFSLPRGNKIIVRHYASSVDARISNREDENRITIVDNTKH